MKTGKQRHTAHVRAVSRTGACAAAGGLLLAKLYLGSLGRLNPKAKNPLRPWPNPSVDLCSLLLESPFPACRLAHPHARTHARTAAFSSFPFPHAPPPSLRDAHTSGGKERTPDSTTPPPPPPPPPPRGALAPRPRPRAAAAGTPSRPGDGSAEPGRGAARGAQSRPRGAQGRRGQPNPGEIALPRSRSLLPVAWSRVSPWDYPAPSLSLPLSFASVLARYLWGATGYSRAELELERGRWGRDCFVSLWFSYHQSIRYQLHNGIKRADKASVLRLDCCCHVSCDLRLVWCFNSVKFERWLVCESCTCLMLSLNPSCCWILVLLICSENCYMLYALLVLSSCCRCYC